MDKTLDNPQPSLIVVAGRPGSGKTSLAHLLSRAVRCPAVCRDEIKEGFVNTTSEMGKGRSGEDVTRKIYEVYFETIKLLLSQRITLVAEAAFQHKVWAPKLESLSEIARIRIVLCAIDPKLARARSIERGLTDPMREQFHYGRAREAAQAIREGRELPIGEYDPPHLDLPMLTVDTSDGYQPGFETIVSFACGQNRPLASHFTPRSQ